MQILTVAQSQLSHTKTFIEQVEKRAEVVTKAVEADIANGDAKVKAAGTKVKNLAADAFKDIASAKTKITDLLKHIEDLGKGEGVLANVETDVDNTMRSVVQ